MDRRIVRGAEARHAGRRPRRQLDIGAEALRILVVVQLDDERAVGKLALEVEAIIGAAGAVQGTDDRLPTAAVGPNRPDAPGDAAVNALRFQRAEDDAAILEDDGVQGAADVDVANLLDVAAVVVHDVQLIGDARIAARYLDLIARAGEGEPAAGHGTRPHVVDAAPDRQLVRGRCGSGLREGQTTAIRR